MKYIFKFLLFLFFYALLFVNANAQSYKNQMQNLNSQLINSTIALRDAVLNSKRINQSICNMQKGAACDRVAVADAELIILDLKIKYQRLSNENFPTEVQEKFSKILEAADNAENQLRHLSYELD
jgi:hypothetical protein